MNAATTLVGVLCEHAAATPDRPALRDEHRSLTYAELEDAARSIADEIANRGFERAPVGVLLDQGVDAIVALYGVMKAGMTAVPLDNASPANALATIMEHAGVATVVTDEASRHLLGPGLDPIVLSSPTRSPHTDVSATELVTESDTASIFYTSGSTGRAKGFHITHGTQVRGAHGWCQAYGVHPDDRLALLFHYSFGASRVSLYGALICGAELRVYDSRHVGGLAIARSLDDDGVTFVHCAPSLLRSVLNSLPTGRNLPGVRLVATGAEAIHQRDIAGFRDRVWPGCQLAYTYAVSEVGPVAAFLLDATTELGDGLLPVGMPLPGKQVTIADPDQDGTGEIVVSGDGVASGYWRDEALTAERFGHDGEASSAPAFRTGDRGRLRPDGMLEFRGRLGTRVKVRGYTVELAEVERELRSSAPLEDVVVVHQQSARSRLVAYVVPERARGPLDVPALRRTIAERLPPYMRPAAFVVLDALPRTGRGKVDVPALPTVPPGRPEMRTEFVAPSDEVQRAVIDVWEHVLDVRPIGVNDDFFELGGDSLMAAESLITLQDRLDRELPLAAFLETATAAGMADLLRRGGEKQWMSPVVPLRTEGSRPPFFCVHGRGGNIMVFRLLADRLSADQPFYALQIVGAPARALSSVERLAAYYLEHVRIVQPQGPYLIGGYSLGGAIAHEMARQLAAVGEPPAVVANIDGVAPDFARGLNRRGPVAKFIWRIKLEVRWLEWRLAWVRLHVARMVLRRPGRSPWRAFRKQTKLTKRALHRYRPGRYEGRVVLFRAASQLSSADLGWRPSIGEDLEIVVVPGTHRSMLEPPHVDVLAEQLDTALSEASRGLVTVRHRRR